MDYDYERLRSDLIDYFGTGAFNIHSSMFFQVSLIEHASNSELINIALNYGFDLNDYKINILKLF